MTAVNQVPPNPREPRMPRAKSVKYIANKERTKPQLGYRVQGIIDGQQVTKEYTRPTNAWKEYKKMSTCRGQAPKIMDAYNRPVKFVVTNNKAIDVTCVIPLTLNGTMTAEVNSCRLPYYQIKLTKNDKGDSSKSGKGGSVYEILRNSDGIQVRETIIYDTAHDALERLTKLCEMGWVDPSQFVGQPFVEENRDGE